MPQITKKELKQELENYKKHLKAGTLIYDHDFDRFPAEELKMLSEGADAYIVALEGGEVRVALVKPTVNILDETEALSVKESGIFQRSTCCP